MALIASTSRICCGPHKHDQRRTAHSKEEHKNIKGWEKRIQIRMFYSNFEFLNFV